MYQNLSSRLPSYKLCAFDFIEEEDRLDRYADLIQKLQPEGTLTLFGYSAGCSLAFEAAKKLEEQGTVLFSGSSWWIPIKNKVSVIWTDARLKVMSKR
nr:thioesterase domain-containing protein [Bacillus subtilis]